MMDWTDNHYRTFSMLIAKHAWLYTVRLTDETIVYQHVNLVLGKFLLHGDDAVYDSLARMAQILACFARGTNDETVTYDKWVEAKVPRYCSSIENKVHQLEQSNNHSLPMECRIC